MNIVAPVSSIMTSKLITVTEEDSLGQVKEIFEQNSIHHIPVVEGREIIGIVSITDFRYFLRGFVRNQSDQITEAVRLKAWKVKDIMTRGLAKVEAGDPIRTALEVFKTNRIHALPVVKGKELVGIVTTYDIIKLLAEEPIQLSDYGTSK